MVKRERYKFKVGLVAIVTITFVLIAGWLTFRSVPQREQHARFLGFTNSVVGPFPKIYSANSTNGAGTVQQWLDAGTNVAVFSITNQQTYRIIVYPYVDFQRTNETINLYPGFVLNAPTAYGIFLEPGEAATVNVAVLPGKGTGRVRFGYTPDYAHTLSRFREELRGLARRKRPDYHFEWFYSDPIAP